ncbi:MAG: hypothetical protein GC171_15975 [Terrimonas sp.]|nr:hypothetical protein [Terrimonas sp.]
MSVNLSFSALYRYRLWLAVLISFAGFSCNEKSNRQQFAFAALGDDVTGLHFSNTLTATEQLNMFNYMYFYNGSGVGAGDFNNDGLTDLFFAANQQENKLYLNEGDMHFRDITAQAKMEGHQGWSTGVSVVDINNDGLLDIYICQVGNYLQLKGHNQLWVCQGIKDGVPYYQDEAKSYGLDFSGFSTQAAFFDYDLDGDLDLFLLNHSVHQNGTFAPRENFLGTYNDLSGDRFFRNDGGKFVDVTKACGINSSGIGYGLGIAVADINLDGWPDLYIGNDFHENDYLYINQKDGRFRDESEKQLMHSSQFSMGVDVADISNDGYPEIISMDMLPADPYMLKRSLGEDDYDIFYYKIGAGYTYQYTRNNLQMNRRNGMFSEIGLYAGVYATDWSWAPLWMDFDNDGHKDLFVSNGIPKRMNDMDYVNFIYNDDIQRQLRENKLDNKNKETVNNFPEIKIRNKFYSNSKDLQFRDLEKQIQNDQPGFSNGAVYADLDNDGDLDIVVNNINDPVVVYQNKTNDQQRKSYVEIRLTGPKDNINAIGSRVLLFANQEIRTYEKNPVKGFLSSMEIPLHIGLDQTKVDSAFIIWPDNTCQPLSLNQRDTILSLQYVSGLPGFDYHHITDRYRPSTKKMQDITSTVHMEYWHQENTFPEFNREPLIPHMVSTEGPALAIGDINNDGLEDVFIGSSKNFQNAIFLQKPGGVFEKTLQPAMIRDSVYEDVDAVWADINHDGFADLVVASGGNEYYGKDWHLLPRVYLNDGTGHFSRLENAFKDEFVNAGSVTACDFNGDGYLDLFLGGRSVPWEYGQVPQSYLLLNDGKGVFTDVTDQDAKGLSHIGMVTQSVWTDIDKDGDKDLVVCCEWGGIDVFMNTGGKFTRQALTNKKGWWNCIRPVDIDNDGDMDFIAGNLGLNSRLTASETEPVRLYYNDFDNNGKFEQVLTYYLAGRELPFANKDELERQIPVLKKKFLYAEDFARASLKDMLTEEKLKQSQVLSANYFSSAILINDGSQHFSLQPLPWLAQLSPIKDAVVTDANGDGLPDILTGGNYYDNNIQMGRYDADFGTVLINKGQDRLEANSINGLTIKGAVRHIGTIRVNNKEAYIIARNNDSTMVIGYAGY